MSDEDLGALMRWLLLVGSALLPGILLYLWLAS